MRKQPESEQIAIRHAAQVCEENRRLWTEIVGTYRSSVRNMTEMPMRRVKDAFESVGKHVKRQTLAVDLHWKAVQARKRELQAAMVLPKIDPATAAEIRQHFAKLSNSKRLETALASMRGGDKRTASALLSAPDYLSGLKGETRQLVEEQMPKLLFPDEYAELEAIDHATGEMTRSTMNLVRMAGELVPHAVGKAKNDDRTAYTKAAALCDEDLERREEEKIRSPER